MIEFNQMLEVVHPFPSEPNQARATSQLHSGFLRSVQHYPDNIALTIGNKQYSYVNLYTIAQRWAFALRQSTKPLRRVGIFAYRSEAAYVGVLASLLAGATFVPLNYTFPIQRTQAMIEQSELDAIIVDHHSYGQFLQLADSLPALPPCVLLPDCLHAPTLDTTIYSQAELAELPTDHVPVAVPPEAIAYLLFTSGSTGNPKGVPISHSNVTHFLKVNQARYQITPADRLSQTFDQTFDLAIFDLFMAWNHGAAVCVLQPLQLLSPFRLIEEQEITVWFSVPSVAALLRKQKLLKPNSLPNLRLSLFCGEALPKATAEAWQLAAPNSMIENLYGPTELTIACAVYRWNSQTSPTECLNEVVPIGKLYPGLTALVVDANDNPVQPGTEGELCVAGPQTFQGYWHNPNLTEQRFLRSKQLNGEEISYYRTGDRVVRRANGSMIYLGRSDQQIKVHGYRVELSEIEGALLLQPGVVAAVALGWPLENGSASGIVAFVIAPSIATSDLRQAVQPLLPNYMLPRTIYQLETMPLNANGKIDRLALARRLEGTA